jgi:hypothetical protein
MVKSRFTRAAGVAALVTALTVAGSGVAASAAVPAAILQAPVGGTLHVFGLPALAFTGNVQITYPPVPVLPPDPVKPIATVLSNVVGTGSGVSCDARGADTVRLSRLVSTLTFTGIYRLYPPVPIIPQNDACSGHLMGVQYVLNLDSAGQVIGVPTATVQCVDALCPDAP